MVGAALGQDPRFDAVFAREDFDDYAAAYAELVAAGGSVAADDSAKAAAAAGRAGGGRRGPGAGDPGRRPRLRGAGARADRGRRLPRVHGRGRPADPPQRRAAARAPTPSTSTSAAPRPETGKLTWEPVEAWASAAGDFGASWGRSRFTPDDPAKPPTAHRYLTVWRRNEAGAVARPDGHGRPRRRPAAARAGPARRRAPRRPVLALTGPAGGAERRRCGSKA